MDNNFLLIDRIDAIRKIVNIYGIQNFVLSFSGGKDSTVLHYLLDLAIPGNKIPRVYIDTGIEYAAIKEYIYSLKDNDERINIIKPAYPIGKIFKDYGYPFKSKEHSQMVHLYQQNGHSKSTIRYSIPPVGRERFGCPKILRYQFISDIDLKISKACCDKLKKEPFYEYQKCNNKPYKLTGERVQEGGLRAIHGDCLGISKDGNLKKFKPLNPMNDDWMDWFIKKENITLCELYYAPYNLKRSGCVGCSYNIKIQDDLNMLYRILPQEYRKAKILWKPVYDEYIRLKYRLKVYPDEKANQMI